MNKSHVRDKAAHYQMLLEASCTDLKVYAGSNGNSPLALVARNTALFSLYLEDLLTHDDPFAAPRKALFLSSRDSLAELRERGYVAQQRDPSIDDLINVDEIAELAIPADENEGITIFSSPGLHRYLQSFSAVLKRFSKHAHAEKKAYLSLTYIYDSIARRTSPNTHTITQHTDRNHDRGENENRESADPPDYARFPLFTDIIGNGEAKRTIKTNLLYLLAFDAEEGKNPYSALKNTIIELHGKPGTGKTMLLDAAARYVHDNAPRFGAQSQIIRIGQEVFNKYFGESERILRKSFERAHRADLLSLILLDEIDGFSSDRYAKDGSEARRSLTSALLREMDILYKRHADHTVFISATNLDYLTDRSLNDRAQASVLVEGPTTAEDVAALLKRSLITLYGNHFDRHVRITDKEFLHFGAQLARKQPSQDLDAVHNVDISRTDISARHLHNSVRSAAARITGGFPARIVDGDFIDEQDVRAIKTGDFLFGHDTELTINKLTYQLKNDHYQRTVLKKDDFKERVMSRAEQLDIDILAQSMSSRRHGTT